MQGHTNNRYIKCLDDKARADSVLLYVPFWGWGLPLCLLLMVTWLCRRVSHVSAVLCCAVRPDG
jgi:hypothetical protein